MEIKQIEKKIVDTIYVAEDGKEFDNEGFCIIYESELRRKRLMAKVEKFEIKELINVPPLDTQGLEIHESNMFRWFNLVNREDFDVLKQLYDIDEPKKYPDVICLEIDDTCHEYESFGMYLSDMLQNTIDFFSKHGMEVSFTTTNKEREQK